MTFKVMRRKYVTLPTGVQVQSTRFCRLCGAGVVALVAAFLPGGVREAAAQDSVSSTSPLEILKQAPKVRFDEPEPTPPPGRAVTPQEAPRQRDPIPYVPPAGPAPPIQPVYPAITPYAGQPVTGRAAPVRDPYYSAPAAPANTPPRYASTPTPRPVLGPEDVEPKKKGGFVRGLINAIPFVGDDDDEEMQEQEAPTEIPEAEINSQDRDAPLLSEPPFYRGYDVAPPSGDPVSDPILMPPGAAPIRDSLPSDPKPSSPPIMTPEPRGSRAVNPAVTGPADDVMPGDAVRPPAAIDPGRPVLTVKRESDTTGTVTDAAPAPAPAPASPAGVDTLSDADEVPKRPEMSRAIEEPTPRPLERATTSVIIQDSRPGDDSLGPQPDSSATPLEPFDPLAPKPEANLNGGVSAADDLITSLTIEQSDLGMPNPTYEQNPQILAEFQEGVRQARADNYAEAARIFRGYGQNHPSSGLAPRAYFLSIIFERSKTQARENHEALKRLFPESRYVDAVAERRPGLIAEPPTAIAAEAIPGETPRQKVERLERDLTAAVGDVTREPALRKELGIAYLEMGEYDRAYEVLRPAVEMSSGQPMEGEILLAMGRVLVARRETVQAIGLYEVVEDKNPDLIYQDASSAWSVGLAFEGAGRYTKARSIYNNIRQKWPETAEAGWAATRLNELAALAQ